MIHITNLDDGLELFKALGSDIRIQILNILLENDRMSMNQLAMQLNISNGALTGHIKKLEEVERTPFFRHVRASEPLVVKMNGKERKSVVALDSRIEEL